MVDDVIEVGSRIISCRILKDCRTLSKQGSCLWGLRPYPPIIPSIQPIRSLHRISVEIVHANPNGRQSWHTDQ